MAIYHLSVKTVSRSSGRSATAAAAYRAGVEIKDLQTGEVHDYTRKGGVESAELILPEGVPIPAWAGNREAVWNMAEKAETRKNSTVAREFEIALPDELNPQQRRDLANSFARELVNKHGFVADVAIHAPGKEGDNRNHHAHILVTTRRLGPEGFTEKTRELDDLKTGEVSNWRARFAQLQNEHLERAGVQVRVDHRSLKEQGIEREPTVHLGPAAAGFERRTGKKSDVRLSHEREVSDRLAKAKEAGDLARQAQQLGGSIIDTQTTLGQLKTKAAAIEQVKPLVAPGIADFKEKFKVYQSIEQAKAQAIEQAKALGRAEAKRFGLDRVRDTQQLSAEDRKAMAPQRPALPAKPELAPAKGGSYSGLIVEVGSKLVRQDWGREYVLHEKAAFPVSPKVGQNLSIQYDNAMNISRVKEMGVKKDRGLGL